MTSTLALTILVVQGFGTAGIPAPLSVIPAVAQAHTLSFEVASVKVAQGDILQTRPNRQGGRVTWTTDLWYLIAYAYKLQPYRMSGAIPGSAYIYAVEATFDPAATDDDLRLMFQSLLKGRFKMDSHTETKNLSGFRLSVAAGGPKISAALPDEKPPLPDWAAPRGSFLDAFEGKLASVLLSRGVYGIAARRASIPQFCDELQRLLGVPVLDETGLKDNFYFAFRYGDENQITDVAVPTLPTAIQELGLKLTRQSGPTEILVVDHIEKVPTAN
jgi:uncharacterized protein (TIGR03435 family)